LNELHRRNGTNEENSWYTKSMNSKPTEGENRVGLNRFFNSHVKRKEDKKATQQIGRREST
jgi:hypothetical protein